jgi:two-component system, NarL family, nitrate/nitrite response regulator NarL
MRGFGRVLVADGDLRLRAQLGVTLAAAGHVVIDAGSVRDAAGLLRTRRPDVVVLDVSEQYQGIALLRALRDEVPKPHPAIVALAPSDDPAASAEAMLLHVEAQLVRPLDAETVLAAVDHVLLTREHANF